MRVRRRVHALSQPNLTARSEHHTARRQLGAGASGCSAPLPINAWQRQRPVSLSQPLALGTSQGAWGPGCTHCHPAKCMQSGTAPPPQTHSETHKLGVNWAAGEGFVNTVVVGTTTPALSPQPRCFVTSQAVQQMVAQVRLRGLPHTSTLLLGRGDLPSVLWPGCAHRPPLTD